MAYFRTGKWKILGLIIMICLYYRPAMGVCRALLHAAMYVYESLGWIMVSWSRERRYFQSVLCSDQWKSQTIKVYM